MPTLITAGDASNGVVVTSSNDNALTIQTGPNGGKVNAIALASDGTMTLNKPMAGGSLTLATAQVTTSGTSIDFTSIPSWVKRITVLLNGVSTNGTSTPMIQLGAGSVDATGYACASSTINATPGTTLYTTGFTIRSGSAAAALLGTFVLTSIGSNSWVCSGTFGDTGTTNTYTVGGSKALSGTLDRVRLTTTGGTDTFDAGSVNILYEG